MSYKPEEEPNTKETAGAQFSRWSHHLKNHNRGLFLSRVIHFDNNPRFAQGTRILVAQIADGPLLHSRDHAHDEQPWHEYGYDYRNFTVISTDATEVWRWTVQSANGIHRGSVNATDRRYAPENETMQFNLRSEYLETAAELSFDRTSGCGTIRIGDATGWLVSEPVVLPTGAGEANHLIAA